MTTSEQQICNNGAAYLDKDSVLHIASNVQQAMNNKASDSGVVETTILNSLGYPVVLVDGQYEQLVYYHDTQKAYIKGNREHDGKEYPTPTFVIELARQL